MGAGAAQIFGALLNTGAQMYQNDSQQAYNERMYHKDVASKAAATVTQMQYNSPQEQMKRLAHAGINPFSDPSLVQSDTINQPQTASPQPAPNVAVGFDLSGFADALLKLDEMKFTSEENKKAREQAEKELLLTLNNQLEMQKRQAQDNLAQMLLSKQEDRRQSMLNFSLDTLRSAQDYDNQKKLQDDAQEFSASESDKQRTHDANQNRLNRQQQLNIFQQQFGNQKDEFEKQLNLELMKLDLARQSNGWSLALDMIAQGIDLIEAGDDIYKVVKKLAELIKKTRGKK